MSFTVACWIIEYSNGFLNYCVKSSEKRRALTRLTTVTSFECSIIPTCDLMCFWVVRLIYSWLVWVRNWRWSTFHVFGRNICVASRKHYNSTPRWGKFLLSTFGRKVCKINLSKWDLSNFVQSASIRSRGVAMEN